MTMNHELYTDSSTRCGCVVLDLEPSIFDYPQQVTNNEGEYRALIFGLDLTQYLPVADTLTCYLDSRLVVDHLNGRAAIKAKHLLPLYQQALGLCLRRPTKIVWLPREHNLAGRIIDGG